MKNKFKSNERLFETLKSLNLPRGKYVVVGSGAMLIRGLREGHDIDVFVTKDLYEEYRRKIGWKRKPCNIDFYLSKDGIELWDEWRPGNWNVEKLISEAEYIDGIAFLSLKWTMKWKKLCGRKKDLEHVKIIEGYLKKN